MIGVVIVTHGNLATEFKKVAELIIGEQEQLIAVALDPAESMESMKKRIGDAIAASETGTGVLVLTDMFGGTPSNLSLPFHKEGKVEVVMGLNLPMLLKIASGRAEPEEGAQGKPLDLAQLASAVSEYGKRNIQAATDILRSK